MLPKLRPGLTYANVMATIAVFVALGGGAYAATQLPKNSVGSKQIKKNAVTSAKVKDRSLLAGDFKAGQMPAGARGPAGAKGDPGTPGTKGDTGTPGPFPATLPSGKTLRGTFATRGTAVAAGEHGAQGISFTFELASAPTPHYIEAGAVGPPAGCIGGSASNPQAEPGNLCVFEGDEVNVTTNHHPFDPVTDMPDIARPWGFGVYSTSAAAGAYHTEGSWAVTAP